MPLNLEEQELVRKALDQIQEAQRLVIHAAHSLSPVNGFADEWSATNQLYDTVKQHWHTVNNRRIQLQP